MEYQNHFFSHKTHVSLVLPIGWEEFKEEEKSVTYLFNLADVLDETDLFNAEGIKYFNPIWIIELFAMPDSSPQNLNYTADALLKKPRLEFTLLRHQTVEVDGYPGLCVEFSYLDPDYKGKMIHYQAFVLVDNVLFSFTGVFPLELKEEFGSVFDEALQSVRFILPVTQLK